MRIPSSYHLYSASLKVSPSNSIIKNYRKTRSALIPLPLQCVLYLSILQIPFTYIFLPGTKDYSIQSITEVIILLTTLTYHRIFFRKMPAAFLAFVGFLYMRVLFGSIWVPDLAWWGSSRVIFRLLLWAWFLFCVLQASEVRRHSLKIYVAACIVAVTLQLFGVGVSEKFGLMGERISAFQQNANALGMIYTIGFLIAIDFATSSIRFKNITKGLTWLGIANFCFIGCLLTASRSAAAASALGLFILFFPRKSIAASFRLGIFALPVLGAVIWMASLYPGVVHRFDHYKEGARQDETRVIMVPLLLEIFLQSPIYGTGPEGYRGAVERQGFGYWRRWSNHT